MISLRLEKWTCSLGSCFLLRGENCPSLLPVTPHPRTRSGVIPPSLPLSLLLLLRSFLTPSLPLYPLPLGIHAGESKPITGPSCTLGWETVGFGGCFFVRLTNCWHLFWLRFVIHFYYRISFVFLAVLHSMWDLSSPTRDRTHAPCIGSSES